MVARATILSISLFAALSLAAPVPQPQTQDVQSAEPHHHRKHHHHRHDHRHHLHDEEKKTIQKRGLGGPRDFQQLQDGGRGFQQSEGGRGFQQQEGGRGAQQSEGDRSVQQPEGGHGFRHHRHHALGGEDDQNFRGNGYIQKRQYMPTVDSDNSNQYQSNDGNDDSMEHNGYSSRQSAGYSPTRYSQSTGYSPSSPSTGYSPSTGGSAPSQLLKKWHRFLKKQGSGTQPTPALIKEFLQKTNPDQDDKKVFFEALKSEGQLGQRAGGQQQYGSQAYQGGQGGRQAYQGTQGGRGGSQGYQGGQGGQSGSWMGKRSVYPAHDSLD